MMIVGKQSWSENVFRQDVHIVTVREKNKKIISNATKQTDLCKPITEALLGTRIKEELHPKP